MTTHFENYEKQEVVFKSQTPFNEQELALLIVRLRRMIDTGISNMDFEFSHKGVDVKVKFSK